MSSLESNGLPHVVGMGGGSGSEMLALAMRPMIHENYTGIVGTFDNGGSTGDIRLEYEQYGLPGYGDLRRVCSAMSQLPDAVKRGFDRLDQGSGKSSLRAQGHAVGNLILAQLHMEHGGDQERLIDAYTDLWRMEGHAFPITLDSRQLLLETAQGDLIEGEHAIDTTDITDLRGARLFLDRPAKLGRHALQALKEADLIVTGLGSMHTSIAPNVLVDEVGDILEEKPVLWVANLMNPKNQTHGWTQLDHLEEFKRLSGGRDIVNRVLYNTAPLPADAVAEQMEEGSEVVQVNVDDLRDAGYDVVGAELAAATVRTPDPKDPTKNRASIMHDPRLLGPAIQREWVKNGFNAKRLAVIH